MTQPPTSQSYHEAAKALLHALVVLKQIETTTPEARKLVADLEGCYLGLLRLATSGTSGSNAPLGASRAQGTVYGAVA